MNRARLVIVVILLIVLAVTLAGAFLTRGVMADLPFLQARKGDWTGAYVPRGVVDQRPWQTAATLTALAQSAEEKELAREAERIADPRSRPGVLAITKAGKPCKTGPKR